MQRILRLAMGASVALAVPAMAQDVNITPELANRTFILKGEPVVIERIQDPTHTLAPDYTKTSRACPPACIQPLTAAPGVATIAELEVMDFLEQRVATGGGLLVDTRAPDGFNTATLPGAVNVPLATLEPTNPYRDEILKALGARQTSAGWDFSNALELALFCDGPWCSETPRAIRNLTDAGYPAAKLKYYRGGMQLWQLFGLSLRDGVS
ncbi:rhodanese-like domain-containing protein [Rhodobacteraceae bacterium D3-12]|nr:rhodanese-like domain-containing protein [Rhodobacteraceae bacterium D3-12]